MMMLKILGLTILLASVYSEEDLDVKILTKNHGEYNTKIQWTIDNFPEMPYLEMTDKNKQYFHSQRFDPKPGAEVQWAFGLEIKDQTSFNLLIYFYPPGYTSSYDGTVDCAIMDDKGEKHYPKSIKKVLEGDSFFRIAPFVKLSEIENNQALPEDQLTIQCQIRGQLKLNLTATQHLVPSEVISPTACAYQIAADSMSKLKMSDVHAMDIISLYSTGRQFMFQKDIIFSRAPLLVNKLREFETSIVFTGEMSDMELEDFASFAFKGEAQHLDETCPTLYNVAKKYGFQCLKLVCGEMLKTSKCD